MKLIEIPIPKDTFYWCKLKPSYIELLAKFMQKGRDENDPDINNLLLLDDMYDEVYQKERIRSGFESADRMALIRVINAVLMGEHES